MLDFKPFQTVKISTVISYKYLKSLFFYSYFPIPPQQTHEANYDWCFGNQFNAYIRQGAPDDVWEQTKKMNDEAPKSPLLGFVPDLKPIMNELLQISSVNDEYAIYKVGADDPKNYWDEYMNKLELAGQQTVLDELQRQVDEFFANK